MAFLTSALVEASSLLKTQFQDFHLIVKRDIRSEGGVGNRWLLKNCNGLR